VTDHLEPVGEGDYFVLKRTISLSSETKPANLWLRAAAAGKIETIAEDTYKIDDRLTLKVIGAKVRKSGGTMELLAPVTYRGQDSLFILTYDW
jgi:hypothetical protein